MNSLRLIILSLLLFLACSTVILAQKEGEKLAENESTKAAADDPLLCDVKPESDADKEKEKSDPRADEKNDSSSTGDKPDKGAESERKTDDQKGEKKPPEITEKRLKQLDAFKNRIIYDISGERLRAIRDIPRLKKHEQEQYHTLLQELAGSDPDPLIREISIRTLGRLEVIAAEPVLIEALKDENVEVQRAAVRSLEKIESKNCGPALFELLKEQDFKEQKPVTLAILRTLGTIQENSAINYLKEKATNTKTNIEIKQEIILYFGAVKALVMKDYLLELAENSDNSPLMRSYAVNSLGKIGDMSVVDPLKKLLKKIIALKSSRERAQSSSIKLQLIAALILLGDESVKPLILAAARDDDSGVRLRAVKQLGEIGEKEARPLLCYRYKNDVNKKVREAAREAILKLDGVQPETDEEQEL